jgi:hypothetical protein
MKIANFSGATLAVTFLLLTTPSYGQDAAPAASAPPPDSQPQSPAAPQPAPFPKQRLDQMLAPIALYPDQLVTNILMAASYPQEVADAALWLEEGDHGMLKGDALLDAIRPLPWDPSIKFLLPFPQLVQQLNDQPRWTQDLGTAFVNQQADVMGEVQHLRQLSMSCGKLQSTPQMTVSQEAGAITIAPANPEIVYVPVYNPAVVYGTWHYPAYPPLYFAPQPGFVLAGAGFGLDVGIGYSVGFGVVGPLWGWSRPNWGGGFVNVDDARMNRFNSYHGAGIDRRFAGGTWRHAGGAGYGAARIDRAASFHAADRMSPRRGAVRYSGGQRSAHGDFAHGGAHRGGQHAHTARTAHGAAHHAGHRGGRPARSHAAAGGRHPGGEHGRLAHGGAHRGGQHAHRARAAHGAAHHAGHRGGRPGRSHAAAGGRHRGGGHGGGGHGGQHKGKRGH